MSSSPSSSNSFPEEIDLVVYINLNTRTDRRRDIEEEFKRLEIPESKIHRWEATRVKKDPRVGCSKSHIAVLEHIATLPQNIQTILILEDDFNFSQDAELVRSSLKKFLQYPRDIWNLCLLSYHVELKGRKDYDSLVSITKLAHRTDGYLINRNCLNRLLENFKEGVKMLIETGKRCYNLDDHWNIFMENNRCFYFNKPLGYQRTSYSDIGGVITERISRVEDNG